MEARTDCPDCRSAGSVERGVCQVCFAELPPPALRFADVVAELESVAEPVTDRIRDARRPLLS